MPRGRKKMEKITLEEQLALVDIITAPPHPTPVPIAVTTAMIGHATLTADNAVSPIRLLTNKPSIME